METILITGFVFILFTIIGAIILLFNNDLKFFGQTILLFYGIIFFMIIGYFMSRQYGLGIPILLLIIVLLIPLVLLSGIKTKTSCMKVDKKDEGEICPVEETFENPSGITINNEGKWAIKMNGDILNKDGTITSNKTTKINKLKKDLEQKKNQCKMEIADKEAQLKKVKIMATSGPCITSDGKWGVRISKYGNQCVSNDMIEKSKTEPQDKKMDKRILDKVIDVHYGDKKTTGCIQKSNKTACGRGYIMGSTKSCGDLLNCDNISYPKYGLTNQEECEKYMKENSDKIIAECIDKEKCEKNLGNYTKTMPRGSDFEKLCEMKFGKEYGLEKVVYGVDGCLSSDNIGRGICSKDYKSGIKIDDRYTDCVVKKTNFLKKCKEKYDDTIEVRKIGGYDCLPGYYRGQCYNQFMINFEKKMKKDLKK